MFDTVHAMLLDLAALWAKNVSQGHLEVAKMYIDEILDLNPALNGPYTMRKAA